MKRREFVSWVGLGCLASSLPMAIAACQSADTTSSSRESPSEDVEVASTPRPDGFAAVGTVAGLDEAGFLSDKNFLGSQVVVVRDPADATAVLGVNSLCTHQGCYVEWDDGTEGFACPCHGSQFNPDGSVRQGPAAEPLDAFEAKIEGELVLVKVT
ncbi:Cytochrome b6-f complex iron-sulfur subunit [Halomicronema hongdechloris C2206]|uniref:Cytochrome b6-f complex iron-sulfur subunit n=1 Tax=Halomicronema hongdechloris C2206 TaxID=1641165 RepID=A0A1Z3HMF0_9CYAN|nr:ubiquinol-cytochrome c reductase iron-sulfur subunit [Halomicronema hongdechloris]ASC71491.1 Cytochrome b6-f complex iron-sulfur subunit [Halomicronema hongdechloris C2206]